PDHPNVAMYVGILGRVLRDQGDRDGAKENFERTLHIFQKFFDEDHPNIRTARIDLESLNR
ncbi:MAG TPA: tetratricopeptide repeat protein, partial [Methanotrichaceae archaeon]|nr:tetratricopeptide repeat protein [Methanotrichaceae archaeon]